MRFFPSLIVSCICFAIFSVPYDEKPNSGISIKTRDEGKSFHSNQTGATPDSVYLINITVVFKLFGWIASLILQPESRMPLEDWGGTALVAISVFELFTLPWRRRRQTLCNLKRTHKLLYPLPILIRLYGHSLYIYWDYPSLIVSDNTIVSVVFPFARRL